MQFSNFDLTSWLMWASVAVGVIVTLTILWFSNVFRVRPQAVLYDEGELPWEEILNLLKSHQGAGGQLPEAWDNLPADQLLRLLKRQVRERPQPAERSTIVDPVEASYLSTGRQRRASRRRWLNPIEVSLTTAMSETTQQGLVVNRSDGGLAIITDSKHDVGAVIFLKVNEAPKSTAPAKLTVRHVRPAGKLWLIGCEYADTVPWNVKVWFG